MQADWINVNSKDNFIVSIQTEWEFVQWFFDTNDEELKDINSFFIDPIPKLLI